MNNENECKNLIYVPKGHGSPKRYVITAKIISHTEIPSQ
jgi:hypothetical protein